MSNSGSCTPMISNPYLWYRSYHFLLSGKVRIQLMQVYSQKSVMTTLPRRPAMLKGGELIHVVEGILGIEASRDPGSTPGLEVGAFGLPPIGANSGCGTGNSGALTCSVISS